MQSHSSWWKTILCVEVKVPVFPYVKEKNQWENVLSSPSKRLDLNVFIGFDDVDFIHCSIPLNPVALRGVISPLLSFLLLSLDLQGQPFFSGFQVSLASFTITPQRRELVSFSLRALSAVDLSEPTMWRKDITSFLRIKASSWSFYNTSHGRMRNRQLFN